MFHTLRKRPVIAVDIDETMTALATHLADFHNVHYGTNNKVEHFNSYLFYEVWGGSPESAQKKISTFFETTEYTSRIKPFKGTFEELSRLKLDFELHVVTARNKKYESLTRDWINQYFPNVFTDVHFGSHFITNEDNVISSHDSPSSGGDSSTKSSISSFNVEHKAKSKSEMCKSIGAIMLIDDNIDYVTDCAAQGIHSILYGNYSWNRSEYLAKYDHHIVNKITRQNNWSDVTHEIYRICEINNIKLISQNLVFAAVQMCSSNSKESNLEKTKRLIEIAYQKGARFICLPECSAFMGQSAAETLNAAEDITGAHSLYISSLRAFVAERSMWLSVGGFPERAVTVTATVATSEAMSTVAPNISSSAALTIDSSNNTNAVTHSSSSSSSSGNSSKNISDNNVQTTKVYNTHVIISPSGSIIQPIYRKMHLFDCPMVGLCESNTTAAGGGPSVFDLGFAVVGLSVCYDLRFPELYSALCMPKSYHDDNTLTNPINSMIGAIADVAGKNILNNGVHSTTGNASTDASHVTKRTREDIDRASITTQSTLSSVQIKSDSNSNSNNISNAGISISSSSPAATTITPTNRDSNRGAEIILIPSAFTVPTGRAHWATLLRARAIENQVYIVAAAQSGRHNEKRESYGHSMIIDPWGDVLSECSINNNSNNDKINNNTHSGTSNNNLYINSGNNLTTTISHNNNQQQQQPNGGCDFIENDITDNGEICYAVFNRPFLSSIRARMPIQSHKRFEIHLPKSKL